AGAPTSDHRGRSGSFRVHLRVCVGTDSNSRKIVSAASCAVLRAVGAVGGRCSDVRPPLFDCHLTGGWLGQATSAPDAELYRRQISENKMADMHLCSRKQPYYGVEASLVERRLLPQKEGEMTPCERERLRAPQPAPQTRSCIGARSVRIR